jgi:hypothetical protein
MISYAAKLVWRHGRRAIDRFTLKETNPWGQAGSCVPIPLQISGIRPGSFLALLAPVSLRWRGRYAGRSLASILPILMPPTRVSWPRSSIFAMAPPSHDKASAGAWRPVDQPRGTDPMRFTLLRRGGDDGTVENWRGFFEERAGIAELEGGWSRVDAEVRRSP